MIGIRIGLPVVLLPIFKYNICYDKFIFEHWTIDWIFDPLFNYQMAPSACWFLCIMLSLTSFSSFFTVGHICPIFSLLSCCDLAIFLEPTIFFCPISPSEFPKAHCLSNLPTFFFLFHFLSSTHCLPSIFQLYIIVYRVS